MIKRKKYILLWMILIFQCIVFIGCDSQYGEKEAFIINNTNKFEEKCKSQFGENTVLFDIKAGSTGNGDLIQQNRKVSEYLLIILEMYSMIQKLTNCIVMKKKD